jgi:hypothetical protein
MQCVRMRVFVITHISVVVLARSWPLMSLCMRACVCACVHVLVCVRCSCLVVVCCSLLARLGCHSCTYCEDRNCARRVACSLLRRSLFMQSYNAPKVDSLCCDVYTQSELCRLPGFAIAVDMKHLISSHVLFPRICNLHVRTIQSQFKIFLSNTLI